MVPLEGNVYSEQQKEEEMETLEYKRKDGTSPFKQWFDSLSPGHALKIRTAVARMKNENFSNVKSVGNGVSERRVNFGPGYRIYFANDGDNLIILLGGGTKKRQQNDINEAKKYWRDYKDRKQKLA